MMREKLRIASTHTLVVSISKIDVWIAAWLISLFRYLSCLHFFSRLLFFFIVCFHPSFDAMLRVIAHTRTYQCYRLISSEYKAYIVNLILFNTTHQFFPRLCLCCVLLSLHKNQNHARCVNEVRLGIVQRFIIIIIHLNGNLNRWHDEDGTHGRELERRNHELAQH